jgi:hypothetical protein
MAKTMRAIEARRLKFTPELLANVRRRFEGSDEPLSTMAADLGCCITTLRGIAKREGWVRYVAPPRGLSNAARLLERAEALAGQQTPFVPAQAGTQEPGGKAVPCGPGSPLSRERTENDEPAVPTPEQVRAAIAELHAGATKELADFKAFRAALKGKPLGLLERERVARTYSNLSATLRQLQVMLSAAPAAAIDNNETAYDDMPADIDAFRDALARRIETFLASRPDAGVDAVADDDGATAPRP